MSPFEHLLSDLGRLLNIHLHPDNHQSCRIQFSRTLFVQIDLDADAEKILIGSDLGKVSSGIYRDHLFREALRANGLSSSPRGYLCYSEKKSSLILFQFLPIRNLNGENLHTFMQAFSDHARSWIEAMAYGDLPQIEEVMVGEKK